jgi:uncharacterized membrane protein YedE/YeeE
MNSIIYMVSLPLAVLLGFVVHRASVCSVRTVAEIFSTRKAHMLAATLKTVLWVIAVSMPILLSVPGTAAPHRNYAITVEAITGGFLFGVGAAINGGCAFSTLGYLASGNLWMLTTVFGFCMGVAGLFIMVPIIEPGQGLSSLPLRAPNLLNLTILALSWIFLCWEIIRLWKTRAKDRSWKQRILSRHYRLSTAALLLGFSGGVLYALHDSWTYTNALKREVQSLWLPIEKPEIISLFLFLSVFSGMLLSAWQRGNWRVQWHLVKTWPRHLIGGALMGAGAVLIPGGNDTLMFKSLPGLSPHAIPAIVALVFGIGITLLSIRLLTGKTLKTVCRNDICQSEY